MTWTKKTITEMQRWNESGNTMRMRNTRRKKALVMLPKVTKFFKNSDVKNKCRQTLKRNNTMVCPRKEQCYRTCFKRKVTYMKKYCEPITDNNAWEPNDVTVESREFVNSESVPDVSVNSCPVRMWKLSSKFDNFNMAKCASDSSGEKMEVTSVNFISIVLA